jgi:hypothetical protein
VSENGGAPPAVSVAASKVARWGGGRVPDAKVGLGQTLGLGGNGTALVLKR